MTDQQKRFLDLTKKSEELSEQISKVKEDLNAVMLELGLNTYVQDPDTLLVYKIVKPNGTFTYYKDIDYKRTAKEGERGGTVLAKKEAEEAGFVLKK